MKNTDHEYRQHAILGPNNRLICAVKQQLNLPHVKITEVIRQYFLAEEERIT